MNLAYQGALLRHLLSAGSPLGSWGCRVALPSRGLRSQDQAPCPAWGGPGAIQRGHKCRPCSERVETGRAPRAQWAPHGWHQCSWPLRPAGTRVQVKVCDLVLSPEKGGHESTCQGVTATSESVCVNQLDLCLVCSKPSPPSARARPRRAQALPAGGVVSPPAGRGLVLCPQRAQGPAALTTVEVTRTVRARGGPQPTLPAPALFLSRPPRHAGQQCSPEGRADLTRASPTPRWHLCYFC